ncbi:MAG: hypothetical protein HKN85_04770 [Gammaproteobacteria bacterium]|nr:hypothetical protein [Gammaproteobacteria bacterium]
MNPALKPALRQSWLTSENFFRLILAALILRILLMPFFGHVDVLSEARRIYFWDESNIYFDDISRNATSLFQLFFFKIFSVFIDNKDLMFSHADMQHSTAYPGEYFEFVSQPDIFRTLFILKIPFLVADLITAWALYQYCGGNAGARRAVLFWLFNPITIFAFYVFGRFESIPVMFCMLSLLAVQRKSLMLAAVMIGLSINSRELFIFFGPLFVALVLSPSCKDFLWRYRVASAAVVIFATAVSVQLISLTGGSMDAFGREVTSIATEGRVDYLFKFIVGSFMVFPMAYIAILLFTWNSAADLEKKSLLVYSMTIIAFFLFSSHTAHYTSWMVVFPCIFYARQPQFLKPLLLLCVTWIVYNLAITDLGVFTAWLASPWSIHFSGLPNFPMMYQSLKFSSALDLLTFSRLARTAYLACLLYITVQMVVYYLKHEGTPAAGRNTGGRA